MEGSTKLSGKALCAHHEAGHAVLLAVAGYAVGEMTIENCPGDDKWEGNTATNAPGNLPDQLLAGLAAELVARRTLDPTDSWFPERLADEWVEAGKTFRDELLAAGVGPAERDPIICQRRAALFDDVVARVQDNWGAIVTVAEQILTDVHLHPDRSAALVGAATGLDVPVHCEEP